MIQFNADGSIRLPEDMQRTKDRKEARMKEQFCIKVSKSVVSSRSPKSCKLRIELSERITDDRFIENIFTFFKERAQTPMKIVKLGKDYEVEVGTDFRRCSECDSLIGRYREHLSGNLIEDTGTCTHNKREFYYEDYFE